MWDGLCGTDGLWDGLWDGDLLQPPQRHHSDGHSDSDEQRRDSSERVHTCRTCHEGHPATSNTTTTTITTAELSQSREPASRCHWA